VASATTSAEGHLWKAHKVSKPQFPTSSSESTDGDEPPPPSKRQRLNFVTKTQKETIEELAIGFIINSNQPFDIFNDPYLEAILLQANPALHATIAWGRTTQRKRLSKVYNTQAQVIRAELRNAISKIHITYDLWTSPNRHAILATSAHFIDADGRQQQRLLAMRQQNGAHSGVNIALTMINVLEGWEINDRLGTLVSDNATNNDTCGQELFTRLYPTFTDQDITDRRIRCYGHILNLVGRAFLYGEDSESFEQESQALEAAALLDDELQLWRQKGPIGKLHNIVKWVRSSPQRSEYFQSVVHEAVDEDDRSFLLYEQSTYELQLITNNETRWNSTYLMINRALSKHHDISTFLSKNADEADPQKRIPEADCLDAEDWRLLAELKEMLEPLYKQTMRTQGTAKQGSHGCLWEVLIGMEYLLERMEAWKVFFDDVDGPNTDDTLLNPSPSQATWHSRCKGKSAARPDIQPTVLCLPEHIRAEYTQPDLQQRLESLSDTSKRYFRLSVMNGWKKLDYYYSKLGESPLYAAAIILHPGLGLRWLEAQWNSPEQRRWLHDAREDLRLYWERWYRRGNPDEALISSVSYSKPPYVPVRRQSTEDSAFHQWVHSRRLKVLSQDQSELHRYLDLGSAHLPDIIDPVAWWLTQREAFPTVSQLALDILAIPAMAADCERAFSLAKLTLTSQRLTMASTTMEQIQCLKNWSHKGAISLGGCLVGKE